MDSLYLKTQNGFLKLESILADKSPSYLISIFFGGALLLAVTKILYNLFLHPVAKFPGPAYAGGTRLVFFAITASGNSMPWLRHLHNRYGDVVRIAPGTLSYTNPQAWKDIYGHRTGGKRSNPKVLRNTFLSGFNGASSLISEPNDEEHGRVRRIFSHAFSDKALREQQSLFSRYINQLVGNIHRDLASNSDHEFDAVKLYNFTTFDIMSDLAFGEALGLLKGSSYSAWVKAIFAGIKISSRLQVVFEYSPLTWLFTTFAPASVRRATEEHFKYSSDRVDQRLKAERDQPDIWNLILRQPEEQRLTVDQMHANAGLFMIAGTETTATLLSGLTFYLLKNPDKMEKLVAEIRSFKTEDELTIDTLPRLKYLTACLEEGLRRYPPVPQSGPPRRTPEGGNIICGEWVPGMTKVFVSQYPAFMSAANFKDPEAFIPERWLPGTGYADDKRDVFQPFAYGPRNCIGKNLAYHEMRLIISKILWNFDLELCAQSENWADQKTYILWEKHPLMVKMKAVKRD